jgi:AraC family transcriptional regulator of adaptative response / DNA-3-methyladenine glycosylase II
VRTHGEPLAVPHDGLTHLFPTPEALAAADPASLPMPAARGRALRALTRALAAGELVLDAGADRDETVAALLALPGIGPWTASYVAMRALGDPDAHLPSDLGVRHALERLGAPTDVARAERWRPWRAYAVQHLWASLATSAPGRPGALAA